jgi:hypothetical protein
MSGKLAIMLFLLLGVLTVSAQDKIIQSDKDTIRCFIREIGDDEIKYSMEGYRSDLIFGIDKNRVSEIIFADGKSMKIRDSMKDPSYYANQRKNALKINFLSPLNDVTAFSYERSLGVARSIEAGIGIIGIGFEDGINDYQDPQGVYLRCGYKFIRSPDFYLKGMHYAHILKGGYIKPEIAFSTYSYKEEITNKSISNKMCAFLLNFGKQWVFDDRFLVDWYAGIGYGFGNNQSEDGTHFAFIGATSDSPIAFSTGLLIGILIR